MIEIQLRELMESRNLTQQGLARQTGIRSETINRIYHGSVKMLPLDVLERLCEALDVEPGDLIKRSVGKEPQGV